MKGRDILHNKKAGEGLAGIEGEKGLTERQTETNFRDLGGTTS